MINADGNAREHYTDDSLYGKIIVIDAIITDIDQTESEINSIKMQLTVELAPGSPQTYDEQLIWTIICPNEVNPSQGRWDNHGTFERATGPTENGNNPHSVDFIETGKTYILSIFLFHDEDLNGDGELEGRPNDGGGCPPNENEVHSLIFTFESNGITSAWELDYKDNLRSGTRLI